MPSTFRTRLRQIRTDAAQFPTLLALSFLVGLANTGCGSFAGRLFPHREKPLVETRADSDWQVTRNFALVVAQDACLAQFVHSLFDNVTFSEGHIVVLSTDLLGGGLAVRPDEVTTLYYGLNPLLTKKPTQVKWRRLRYVSQFGVERSKWRVEVSVDYTETEARAVLHRLYPSPSHELPTAAERRLHDLRSAQIAKASGRERR